MITINNKLPVTPWKYSCAFFYANYYIVSTNIYFLSLFKKKITPLYKKKKNFGMETYEEKMNRLKGLLQQMVIIIRQKLRSYKNHMQANGETEDGWRALFEDAENNVNGQIEFEEDIFDKANIICRIYEVVQQLPFSELEEGYESSESIEDS